MTRPGFEPGPPRWEADDYYSKGSVEKKKLRLLDSKRLDAKTN
jgi:hypothetical protein